MSDISNYSKISKNSENKKIISDRSNINCCIGTKEMFRNEELLKELNEAQIKNKERLEIMKNIIIFLILKQLRSCKYLIIFYYKF